MLVFCGRGLDGYGIFFVGFGVGYGGGCGRFLWVVIWGEER